MRFGPPEWLGAAVLAAAVAGPAVAAVAELARLVVIIVIAVVVPGSVGGAALVALRLRHAQPLRT